MMPTTGVKAIKIVEAVTDTTSNRHALPSLMRLSFSSSNKLMAQFRTSTTVFKIRFNVVAKKDKGKTMGLLKDATTSDLE